MTSTPSIAIVGAGPAGLTLAKLLLVSAPDINLTIYELDTSPKSRAYQGGTLDLHPQTGLLALKKCGLWDAALPFLRYEGEELVIGDKNGTKYVHMKEAPEMDKRKGKWDQRPEIDREKLKEILLEGVGEDRVRWGTKVKKVTVEEDSGRGSLEFENGNVEGPFDLTVGADGAFSKVRNVLTDVKPRYSGICGVESGIARPRESCPEVDKMVGRGSYFAYSGGRTLMGQRMGDNSIKIGTWVRRDKEWVERLWKEKGNNLEDIRDVLLEEYKDWTDEQRDWIRAGERFKPWALWELPVGHTWEHRHGFTLLGDAAHLCTPFAGLGVNAAMKDALDLSELIVESVSDKGLSLDEAVAKYEKTMFPRAHEVQARTMQNKEGGFRSDAPLGFMSGMIGVIAKETGWPLDKGVLKWMPITKMAYSAFWFMGISGAFKRWLSEMLWPRTKPA